MQRLPVFSSTIPMNADTGTSSCDPPRIVMRAKKAGWSLGISAAAWVLTSNERTVTPFHEPMMNKWSSKSSKHNQLPL